MAKVIETNKKEPYWIKYVRQRIRNNKNFLGLFSGPTGSGKSWSAISMANQIDPNFNVDRVVFKGKELMKLINDDKLPKRRGNAIVWDEAGVEMSHRNWQSTVNQLLNYLIQTFRHRNIILIFTAPYQDFIDASTRKLFHAELKTQSVNKKEEYCRVKPQCIQYNDRMNKFYYKYLKVVKKGKGILPVKAWKVKKPPEELIEKYEAKKTRYTNRLNKDIQKKLEMQEGDDRKPLTDLQNKILKFWKKGITKQITIADKLDKKQPQISENYKWMRKKGYRLEDYQD